MSDRAKILEAFRKLLCGATEAGDRVIDNPPDLVWEGATPAVLIHTRREDPIDVVGESPRVYRPHLELWFDAYRADDRLDVTEEGRPRGSDQMDILDEQVKDLVLRNIFLRGLVAEEVMVDEQFTRYLRWERDFRVGEQVIAASRLTIVFAYRETIPSVEPEATMQVLNLLGVDINLAGTSSDLEAQHEIDTSSP